MITINLLPQQTREKTTHFEKDIVFILTFLVLIGAAIFGTNYYISEKISNLKYSIEQKTITKAQLEIQLNKINQHLKDIETLNTRIKMIKDIRLRQGLPVKYIDELVINLPKDKLWIEKFSLNANGQITLSGVALDNQSFADYVEKIRASKYIALVDTQRTSRTTVSGLGLISFDCSVVAQEYFENQDTNGTTNG